MMKVEVPGTGFRGFGTSARNPAATEFTRLRNQICFQLRRLKHPARKGSWERFSQVKQSVVTREGACRHTS